MQRDATSPGKAPREHKLPLSAMAAYAIAAGAGLILGAFLSRVLAEAPFSWPLSHGRMLRWGPTLALTLGVGAAFAGICALRAKRRDPQSDVPCTPRAAWSKGGGIPVPVCIPFYVLVLYLAQPAPDLLQAGVLFGGALVLSLLLSGPPGLEAEWPVWLLLFLVPLIAYLNTLMPAVGTRDGYELQAISATLGFAHPTGYPLFPILGRLWLAIFPTNLLGSQASIAWRINVLCATLAAASVPLAYGTARRVLDRPLAAWSALIYAFSHTLWAQASQPEKYTLNAMFVALILYVTFGTGARPPSTEREPRGPHPHLRWLGFLYGLSLTHHRTMLMLAPALALCLLWRDPGLLKRPKEWLPALGIALAPLLIYLYIPWRAYTQGWAMTPSEFLRYISGAHYGPAVRLMDWANPERALMFWRFVVEQFGYVGVALGALGLVGLALRRQWRFLASTALAYATYYAWGTVWYAYYNDVNSFIPNHLILAIWIGSGVRTAWTAIDRLTAQSSDRATIREGAAGLSATKTPHWQRVYRAATWSLVALMPMWLVWANGPQVDRSEEWASTRWGEKAMASDRTHPLDIAPSATILADREKYPPLDYFARIEQHRPDVDVVLLGDEQAYLDRLAWDLAHDTPVYLARFLPGLEGPYHLSSAGPLVKVSPLPLTEVGGLEGMPALFQATDGTGIELLGYRTERDLAEEGDGASSTSAARGALAARDSLCLTLFWRADAPIPGNYHVTLRWVSATGQQWWTSSDHPVSGMYPTAAWKPGEIVADWHEIPVGEAFPPGTYTAEVGLFRPYSQGSAASPGEGLPAVGTDRQWAPLASVEVTPRPGNLRPPRRLNAVAPGRLALSGYDLPEQAPPTGRVTLRLYWHPLASLPDYQIGTRVGAQDAALRQPTGVGAQDAARGADAERTSPDWTWATPGRGEYPSSSWTPGTTVLTEHPLIMPASEGRAIVQIAVREGDQVLFYPRWLAPQTPILSLPPIEIAGQAPATPGAINFDDRILLLADDLEQRSLSPGAPLELTVRWQGMQPMDADYTLFIHILAPDGTLKGQIDVWPRDGTYPTSQWHPGEAFEDRYLLYVDPDAPPGAYQVEIGWYLLETMRRLPVMDAQGRAIDDRVLLSGLTVQ